MLNRQVENWYPTVVCLGVLIVLRSMPQTVDSVAISSIINAFFVIFSIFCGFISTSLSILFSLQDRRAIKKMKDSNAFYEIIVFHWRAILWCAAAIIMAFAMLFSPKFSFLGVTCLDVMFSVGVGACSAVYRVIYFFVRILQLDK